MKKILALAIVLAVLVLSLASCAASIKGKWVYSATVLGQEMKITLDFKSNGKVESTVETTVNILGVKNTSTDTDTSDYTFDGKTLTIDGEETKYEIKDNTLKLAFGEVGYVEFKRP